MNQEDLFFASINSHLSELELYLKYGKKNLKIESAKALDYDLLSVYNKTKSIEYLKNDLNNLKIVYNYLEEKLLKIRKLN